MNDIPFPWHWEGHVQSALVSWLRADGWTITQQANTATKARGIDIVARRDDRWLAVEVKGYPETTYADAARRGQLKPTAPANQATKWFSHALLAMLRMRNKRPDAEIALCFPDFPTYRRLIDETKLSFELLGFGVYLVGESGDVTLVLPHIAVGSREWVCSSDLAPLGAVLIV